MNTRKAKILIVDDDKDFADSLAESIEAQGHEVTIAYSGEQAVREFRNYNFDLALLDVKLPGMDGVECLMELRRIKPDAQVMMMTGFRATELH